MKKAVTTLLMLTTFLYFVSANEQSMSTKIGRRGGEPKTTHGFGKHKLFKVWSQFRGRCQNKNHPEFKNYGARGISVCNEWDMDAGVFIRWALANGYKEGLTLDRRDFNGHYEPSNCRFITITAQLQNTRKNIIVTIDGVTKCLSEWARFYGMCRYDLRRKYLKANRDLAKVLINTKSWS